MRSVRGRGEGTVPSDTHKCGTLVVEWEQRGKVLGSLEFTGLGQLSG